MIGFKSTGNTLIGGHIELALTEAPFSDITFYYEGMKFNEEENADGSINMSFNYNITSEKKPDDVALFEKTVGDLIIQILEEQIKNNEVVYTGGSNEVTTKPE